MIEDSEKLVINTAQKYHNPRLKKELARLDKEDRDRKGEW